jgi:serine/threonine protein kinase
MEQLIDLIYKFLRTEFKKVDRRKESRRRFPLAYEVFDLYVPTGRTWPKENPKGVQTLTPGKQTEVNITRAGSKLGEGAYGKVYKKKIGKSTVAIKQQQQSPSSMLEIAIMRTLRHKNIQQIKEFSFQGDEVFIQMSVQKNSLSGAIYTTHTFLDGVRARDAIWYHGLTPFKVIDLPLRRYYGKQLMAGLAYLHDNGVIHADLKPANILITASNTLKIADFGLSQIFVPSQFDFSRRDWNVVTLPYRDINIIKKSVAAIDNIPQYTFDIDIWAAAVTLMELETGSCPFGGFNTEAETLVSIENLLGKYTKPTHHLGTEYYLTNINSLPFKVLLLQMLDYDSSRRITSHQAHALL